MASPESFGTLKENCIERAEVMPRILGPVPADKWEREVRRQLLKQLPDNWTVICNVSWALKNERGFVRDGEADFVVLAPDLGLVVVEVKGSVSVRVGDDGVWYRREDYRGRSKEVALRESPPEQANRNTHTIASIIKQDLLIGEYGHFPGLHAFLVVYPNGSIDGSVDLYDPSTIAIKSNMHTLRQKIKSSLLARGQEGIGKKFTQELVNRVALILTNQRFRIVSVDTELDLKDDEKNIDELTHQQFAALRGAFDLPKVAIIGPAGSGKTLLAIWKFLALLEEGKKAIFVCFNTALATDLRFKHPEAASSIVNVDALFLNLVDDKKGISSENFFSNVLPERVMDALFTLNDEDKYDAIIIDEGQDFGDGRIIALHHLLVDKPDAQWLYFADNKQNLYGQSTEETLGAEVTFRLYHNCRNTVQLNAATNEICSAEVKPMPGMPRGEIPQVIICKSEHMADKAWSLVHELSPNGGAVILSPYTLKKSCMSNSPKAYGLTLTENLREIGRPGFVFFSTIKSFKGLEAPHVVLVHADKPNASQALAEEDLYVALTRATSRIDIVTSNKGAEEWFAEQLQTLL